MKGRISGGIVITCGLAILAMMFLAGCSKEKDGPSFASEYQAIFLDNGQIFFAKLENADADYPLLRDVYYVQSRVNPDTKQATNVLIKRGNEWHAPDYMYISAKHIVVLEPVAANSRVAQLIKEAKTQAPAPTPKQ
jgi:hypothetical protein